MIIIHMLVMGHRGGIDTTCTTDKSILPEKLIKAMKYLFICSEEYLDIETTEDKTTEEQMQNVHTELQKINPEKLGTVFEALQNLNASKILQVRA